VFAAIRGYHRQRGWLAWHVAVLSRVQDLPELHTLTGEPAPRDEETDAEMAERVMRNSMAWVIVTGGNAEPKEPDDG